MVEGGGGVVITLCPVVRNSRAATIYASISAQTSAYLFSLHFLVFFYCIIAASGALRHERRVMNSNGCQTGGDRARM